MKKRLFRKTLYDCRQATFLVIKSEESPLTLPERAKLFYHLLHCSVCKSFVKQSKMLDSWLSHLQVGFVANPPFRLDSNSKLQLQNKLNALMNNEQ